MTYLSLTGQVLSNGCVCSRCILDAQQLGYYHHCDQYDQYDDYSVQYCDDDDECDIPFSDTKYGYVKCGSKKTSKNSMNTILYTRSKNSDVKLSSLKYVSRRRILDNKHDVVNKKTAERKRPRRNKFGFDLSV